MTFISKRIKTIRNDRLLSWSFLIATLEAACHIYEVFCSGFDVSEIIRAVFCVIYILTTFFICRINAVYLVFSSVGLALLYFNKYTNYTSFFIIVLTIQKMPKARIPLLLAYLIDLVVCLLVGHRMAHHMIIHVLNCAWIYAVLNMHFFKGKRLNLMADERLILSEWVRVQELKAVESFSRQTVFDKLKAARERNGIEKNEELKARFLDEISTEL